MCFIFRDFSILWNKLTSKLENVDRKREASQPLKCWRTLWQAVHSKNFDIIRTVSAQLHTASIHHSSYRSSIYFWVSDSEASPTVGGTLRTHQFWFVLEFTARHTACSHCERHHHEPNKWRGMMWVLSSGFRTSQETQKLQKSPELIWGWVGFRCCRSGVWCHATDWTGFFVRWRWSGLAACR